MNTQSQDQSASKDLEHLRLLSIFHYVAAGVLGFFSCAFIFHIVFGLIFLLSPEAFDNGEPPPPFMGWLFLIMGSAAVLSGWTLAILLIVAGRFLKKTQTANLLHGGGGNILPVYAGGDGTGGFHDTGTVEADGKNTIRSERDHPIRIASLGNRGG